MTSSVTSVSPAWMRSTTQVSRWSRMTSREMALTADSTAAEVLRGYVLSRPDALYAESALDGNIAEHIAQDNYMLTRDGITVYLGDYDFFPYASGTHEVLVWPTGDKAAGTDVTGDYAFPYDE